MFTKKDQALSADNLNAENWNPEEFQELILEDLDNIAGGRALRPSERAELDARMKQASQVIDKMMKEGNYRNASEYYKMCCSCAEQYQKAVANAPEDGPDIPISKYFGA